MDFHYKDVSLCYKMKSSNTTKLSKPVSVLVVYPLINHILTNLRTGTVSSYQSEHKKTLPLIYNIYIYAAFSEGLSQRNMKYTSYFRF